MSVKTRFMFSEKNALYQQIDDAIRNNWSKQCIELLGKLSLSDRDQKVIHAKESLSLLHSNSVVLDNMKEKIHGLEELNGHLFYFINFLVENLPELIIRTVLDDSRTTRQQLSKSFVKERPGNLQLKRSDFKHPTRREEDVLELLEKGLCAKEIARKLYISETTVITHKKNLKRKYMARNTAELISKARGMEL